MSEESYAWQTKLAALRRVAQYRPFYTTGIIVLSVGAAALEGIGLSFILPIIELAQMGEANPNNVDGILGAFVTIYQEIGIPFTLGYLIVGVAFVMTIRYTLSFLVTWFRAAIETQYVRFLQERGFENALDARIAYYDEEGSDDILNAIVTQSEYAGRVIRRAIAFVEMGLVATVYLAIALYIAPGMTILTAMFLGGMSFVFRRMLEGGYSLGDKVAGANERIQTAVQTGTQGIREVKLFDMRSELISQFNNAVDQFETSRINLHRNKGAIRNFYELMTAVSVFVLIYVALTFTALSIGELGIFLFAIFRLGPYVSNLNQKFYQLEGELPHLVRTQLFIDNIKVNTELDRGNESTPDQIETITFDSVEFSYDTADETVLQGVSFRANRGEFIGFVGPSGAGKSTIASLFARMYRPDRGEIRVNGISLNRFDLSEWRSRISVVQQKPYIFNDTVRSNVTIGNRAATQEEIEQACKVAQVTEFLDTLPQGYDTVLGEDGVKLSGGQRQRIAIARAILKDTDLLVLDEATSDLDTALEKQVHQAIEQLDREYTIIVIAHRLSTLVNADLIYTIEDGTIVERGSHKELLEQQGTYARLHDIRN